MKTPFPGIHREREGRARGLAVMLALPFALAGRGSAQNVQPLPPVHLHFGAPAATGESTTAVPAAAASPAAAGYAQPTSPPAIASVPAVSDAGESAPAYVPPPIYVPAAGGGGASEMPAGAEAARSAGAVSGVPDDLPPPSADLLGGKPAGREGAASVAKPSPKAARLAAEKADREAAEARLKAKRVAAEPKTPELEIEPGKQLLDSMGQPMLGPEGHPMFSPPVMQLRDHHGKPVFANGKPVFQTAGDLGYDGNGKAIVLPKTPVAKGVQLEIERGAFTVDGIVGKVQLDYDIGDLHFLYLYVPGMGVTVVSDAPFPGAVAQADAFDGETLTVKTAEHVLQVSSDKPLLGKRREAAYVMVDRHYRMAARFPVVGYGTTRSAPYQWPGSKTEVRLAGTRDDAPPVPMDLRPKLLDGGCAGAGCAPVVVSEPAAGATAPGDAARAPAAAVAPAAAAQGSTATDTTAATPVAAGTVQP